MTDYYKAMEEANRIIISRLDEDIEELRKVIEELREAYDEK